MKAIGAASVDPLGKVTPIGVADGAPGWTPVFAFEQDGTRTLLKVVRSERSNQRPSVGYLTATGDLASDKTNAGNFNVSRRVSMGEGTTAANGRVRISFLPAFAQPPAQLLVWAAANGLTYDLGAVEVAGSRGADGVTIEARARTVLGGALNLLAGAVVRVIAIET